MRIAGVLAAGAVVLGGLASTATPAQAAWRDGTCGTNDFCVFTDLSFQTTNAWKDLPNAVATWTSLDSSLINEDSSWRNKYVGPIRVYNSAQYAGGVEVCVDSGIARSAGVLSLWDDDGNSNHNVAAC